MTLDQKKALIRRFLYQCNAYADDQLARYRKQLAAAATGREALVVQDKISHWTAYQAFNEYTLEELTGDMLDAWFDEPLDPSGHDGPHDDR